MKKDTKQVKRKKEDGDDDEGDEKTEKKEKKEVQTDVILSLTQLKDGVSREDIRVGSPHFGFSLYDNSSH